MNYKASGRLENELLLCESNEKIDELKCNTSTRVTTTKQYDEEIQLLASDSVGKDKDTTKTESIDGERDGNTKPQYGDYLANDLKDLHNLYNNQSTAHGNQTISSQTWVSFDETASSQFMTSEALQPKQTQLPIEKSDFSVDHSVKEGDWVQFEAATNDNIANDGREEVLSAGNDGNYCRDDKLLQSKGNMLPAGKSSDRFEHEEIFHENTSRAACNTPISREKESTKPSSSSIVAMEEIRDTPLPPYPTRSTNTRWAMLLRYPDSKRTLRRREWRRVIIKLNGSILQIFHEHDSTAPFREVSLQCFYDFTVPALQHYHGEKVHTVKILYVKYKEINKLISKKNVHYIAKATPILKIASSSHIVIKEFVEVVRQAIRSLPIFRDRGISHNTDAVYINVHDTCTAIIDGTGSVEMLGILVRIYMRAFISGEAECELVLNDINMKSKEEERLRGELMPQRVHKWIKLEECDFHSTVNSNMYNQDCSILLSPLDSCTFEVMQFRVRPVKPLPLLAKCELVIDTQGRVEIHAEVKLCSDPKLAKYERKNICLYFPIPEPWVRLFMRDRPFLREKSIKSTNSQKAIKMRNRRNRPFTTIEVSTGSAKYDPAYKSVVWQINSLPLLNTTAPADSTHDFLCCIQTMESIPDGYKPTCVMEYEIPYTVASDTNVVNFKVMDNKISTKEVTYHTSYTYEIRMQTRCLDDDVNHEK